MDMSEEEYAGCASLGSYIQLSLRLEEASLVRNPLRTYLARSDGILAIGSSSVDVSGWSSILEERLPGLTAFVCKGRAIKSWGVSFLPDARFAS